MIYKHSIRISFQDIDAAGVVFFAHFFRYAHEAYEAFMREIRQPLDSLLAEGKIILPIVHTEADYRQPAGYAESMTVELKVEAIGESRFSLIYDFINAKGDCVTQIKTVHACRDAQTKNKRRIAETLRTELQTYQIAASRD